MKEKIEKFLMDILNPQLPMRIRFFNICTLGGTAGALLATIAPIISGVNSTFGLILSSLTAVFFFSLFLIGHNTGKNELCIMVGVIGLNFIIYPLLYFSMGGIEGGMVLYFVMGIVFTLLLLDFKSALIIFPLEIAEYSLIFYLGEKHPGLFSTIDVYRENIVLDIALDFFIVSLTTFFVIKILYNAYEDQAKKANKLVQ